MTDHVALRVCPSTLLRVVLSVAAYVPQCFFLCSASLFSVREARTTLPTGVVVEFLSCIVKTLHYTTPALTPVPWQRGMIARLRAGSQAAEGTRGFSSRASLTPLPTHTHTPRNRRPRNLGSTLHAMIL